MDEPAMGKMMLSTENSESLVDAFKSSLRHELVTSEKIALLESGTVDEVISVFNSIQLDYLKNHKATESESRLEKASQGSRGSSQPVVKVPFTDCIQTHIDTVSGELNGFTIRP
jgi:hypothetical protein